MKTNRRIAGGVALALVAALVGLAVVAGRDSAGGPAVLPVLGSSGGRGAAETMAADASTDMRMAGRVEYRTSGKLPGLDEEADAWVVPAEEVSARQVAELAAALGVDGEPERTDYGWSVADDTRRLDVQDVAGNPWSLYESMPEPMVAESRRAEEVKPEIQCIQAPCEGEGSSGSTGTMVEPVPAPDCAADACDEPMEVQRPADLPSKAEAEEIGRRLLTELGVDVEDAAIRVDDAVTQWMVNADPVIGGLPTFGLATSVSIGPKGVVQYANGWLGEFTKGDRYPLIGTAAGLEKLDDEQMRVLMVDPAVGAPECVDCPEVDPVVIEITGVRLGLQLFSTYEQGADGHLVPSYLFSTADGGELPVIAIAEEFLAPRPEPEPIEEPGVEPEPEPEPGRSTGECAGTEAEGIAASVCVTSAPAGEPVTIEVAAKGMLRDDCGSPTVDFGDSGDGMAVCTIGCESLPPEPVELQRTFEHVYAEPGTYDLVVSFWGCGADSGSEQLSLPIQVRVEG